MGVRAGCTPRKEVLKGDLEDAIFAADFGDLVAGKAPKVYSNAKVFFQNTHPAKQLCKVVQAVFGRLANPREGGASIRLSTGFGGGKTHTLMALWHLAENVYDAALGTELLPAAGRPTEVTVVAVDASKAGVPVFARHGKVLVHSLWGEMAYGLAGEKGLKTLGGSDDPELQPDESLLDSLFPKGPVLLLLDEIVIYMATLSERGQANLLAFLNKLTAAVVKRPQTVLVVTDPADQRAYAREASKVGDSIAPAAEKLDDVFGRKMSDFDPIGNEAARVIVRRLFERVDPSAAQAASAAYHALYQRVFQESPGSLPAAAASAEYARRIVESYPFHPRLLDTAQGRLGALQEFNKSRGTLRLFARILRAVFESPQDLDLISAGDLDWSDDRIQADLLQRLNRDSFRSAVAADVEKHAAELDGGANRGVHVRVASALLLESIPMQANSGMDPADLTLAVLRPDEAGHEPAESLDRLVGVCWHTYPMPGGRGWQFRYEPNVIKQIEERMSDIPLEDARSRLEAEVQGYFQGPIYRPQPWPLSPKQVPEAKDLQVVLCREERIAKAVSSLSDDTDPNAPVPRKYQNAIVCVTSLPTAVNGAVERAQRLLAAEAIEKDHRSGESNKLVREQLLKLKPELTKQFRIAACRAFDRVVLAGGATYAIEEKYQVPDEKILERAQGQSCLKEFLEAKNLVYKAGDVLDAAKFLGLLPGAVPVAGSASTYTARAIHERFLAAPNLRLVPDAGIVRQTILRAVAEGKVAVRLPDGRAYDARGCVEGAAGRRRRVQGTLASLALDDDVLVSLVGSETATAWMREDSFRSRPSPGGWDDRPIADPRPPEPTPVTASTWEKAIDLAMDRPLMELRLRASKPADASTLVALAQPLGAESLTLNVSVSGQTKDGGNLNFAANEVKPNHPTKPLGLAQTVFNALTEGSTYEAELALGFGPSGRTGVQALLQDLARNSSDGVRLEARFAKPAESQR